MVKEWWIVSIVVVVGSLVRNCQASNGTSSCAPSIKPLNFDNFVSILNGTNRTLSCEIRSDTPLKGDPIWRRDYSPRLPDGHSVNNSSCSLSTNKLANKICVMSNLTLIHVVQGHYEGNYSLTAENDCGNTSVYVYVNIMVLPSCITDRPPKLLTPPPLTVRAVQGESVIIKAVYKGNINEDDLLAYWCVTTLDGSHCILPIDNDTTYQVTTDGCPPTNVDCCYFSVSIQIKSLTLNLSQANLTSEAVWREDPRSFNAGNSTLVVYVYPTLVEQLPSNLNNKCIEVYEGQSTEFRCKYLASTNPNITITTWKFNEIPLQHNLSHYTMITDYGTDPINANSVLSRLILSNVVAENAGTYTCQCGYNSDVIYNKGIVSDTGNFCLKVNTTSSPSADTGKKWQYYIQYALIAGIPTVIMVVAVVLLIAFIYLKRRKSKKLEMMSTQYNDETRPLLNEDAPVRPLLDLAAGDHKSVTLNVQVTIPSNHSINHQHKQMNAAENIEEKSPAIATNGDVKSTDQTRHQELISGQALVPTVTVIPSHSKVNRQHGDLVTGSTTGATTADVTVHESDGIHDQLSVPEQVDHSTSLESLSKSPNGNEYTNQSTTLESCTQDNSSTITGTKPSLVHCPTTHATECEPEGPRTSKPAICSAMPSGESNDNEGFGDHNRIINSIAPCVTSLVNLEALVPYLQKHQLLTNEEESYLSNMLYSSITRAQMLLRYLKHKGDGSLQMFLCSLNSAHEHKGHKELAEKLKKQMQTTGIYCTDFCSDCQQH